MPTFYPDGSDWNADWSKRSWDLPKTVNGFMEFLIDSAADNQRDIEEEWRAFLTLRSSHAMPQDLRQQVEARIYGER